MVKINQLGFFLINRQSNLMSEVEMSRLQQDVDDEMFFTMENVFVTSGYWLPHDNADR